MPPSARSSRQYREVLALESTVPSGRPPDRETRTRMEELMLRWVTELRYLGGTLSDRVEIGERLTKIARVLWGWGDQGSVMGLGSIDLGSMMLDSPPAAAAPTTPSISDSRTDTTTGGSPGDGP